MVVVRRCWAAAELQFEAWSITHLSLNWPKTELGNTREWRTRCTLRQVKEMMRLAASCILGPCGSPNITNADRASPSRKCPQVKGGWDEPDRQQSHASVGKDSGGISTRDNCF
jgi:hypothetical protein